MTARETPRRGRGRGRGELCATAQSRRAGLFTGHETTQWTHQAAAAAAAAERQTAAAPAAAKEERRFEERRVRDNPCLDEEAL